MGVQYSGQDVGMLAVGRLALVVVCWHCCDSGCRARTPMSSCPAHCPPQNEMY